MTPEIPYSTNPPFPRLEMVSIEDQVEGKPPYALFWITGVGQADVVKSWMVEPTSDDLQYTIKEFSDAHPELASR